MTDQLLDAVSKLNENHKPYLNNCTLVVGDGTAKVEFKDGRARIPAGLAPVIGRHPHIDLIQTVPVSVPAPAAAKPAAATASPPPAVPTVAQGEGKQELAPEVLAAMEHLKEEGEDVPEPEAAAAPSVTNAAFEPLTTEGQPRCQAAKGDGSQCSNPTADGTACGLPAHKQQLTA